MGYSFRDIPGLTWTEINALLLGFIVNKEAESGGGGGVRNTESNSAQRAREHKQSIRRRLQKN